MILIKEVKLLTVFIRTGKFGSFWRWTFCLILFFSMPASAEKIIPNALIAMETNRPIDYMILVEKETQTLFVYAYDGQFREIKRFRCSTGENRGSKKQSGDRKTPEGVYFINNRFTKRDLTPIYGTRAFPTDYPNYMDRFAGKNGSAIWVHGTNKKLKDRDTNGCVAMVNKDIDALDKYIDLHHTPIIIQKRIKYVHPSENEPVRISLIQFLRKLENLLMFGEPKAFFSHFNYISDYYPKWWGAWEKMREDIKNRYPESRVQFTHPIILKHDRIFVALFDQQVISGSIHRKPDPQNITSQENITSQAYLAGKKKLFIVRYKEQWRIVGEEYQTSQTEVSNNAPLLIAASHFSKQSHPMISSITPQALPESQIKTAITQVIDNWLEAWRSKNIEQYGRFYADNFRSQGKNKQQWIKYKNYLNQKYEYIKVNREKIDFQFYKNNKKRVKAFFKQTYESNAFSAYGRKTLTLTFNDGQWRIYREYWNKQ